MLAVLWLFSFPVREVPLLLGPSFSESTEELVEIPSYPWAAAPHPSHQLLGHEWKGSTSGLGSLVCLT